MKLFHKLNGKWSEVTSSNGGDSSGIELPSGGVDGQILAKDSSNEFGLTWVNQNKTEYPDNGVNGQILIHDNTTELGAKWGLIQAPHNMNIGDMGYTYSDNPPSNALFCGGLVSKTQYPELYSIIGDKFTSDSSYISKDKLMVPEWNQADQSNYVSDIKTDFTLGANSYHSAVINGNIKIAAYGNNGALHTNASTYWYVWNVFNPAMYTAGTSGNYPDIMWHGAGNVYFEIEFPEAFALYSYEIREYYPGYTTQIKVYGYDENISSYTLINEFNTSSNPTVRTTVKIESYDNTITYKKYKFEVTPNNTYFGIDILRLYGTKEGEDNVYNLFALPPSVEDTTGAKNYIVATSGNDRDYNFTTEERVIGTWIDGRPIYRKVFTGTRSTSPVNLTSEGHYDEIINYYGYFVNGQEKLPIHIPYNSTNFIIVTINNNNIRLEQYGYTSGTDYRIIVEYTKISD